MLMNSFAGKELLSLIRDGDYAHGGEEEAIAMAMRGYAKRAGRLILDVGCGRGGTAQYVQDHGWGKVVGIDREPDSILRAGQVYPGVEFHACDVLDAADVLDRRFDLIYLFNSFYAFDDQARALEVLGELAKRSSDLLIFDYLDRGGYDREAEFFDGEPFIPHPIRLGALGRMIADAGWQLRAVHDLTLYYESWYDRLVRRIDRKRAEIVAVAGATGFNCLRRQYSGLLAGIRRGVLGGAVVRATRR